MHNTHVVTTADRPYYLSIKELYVICSISLHAVDRHTVVNTAGQRYI